MQLQAILSVSLILFTVIDIVGSLPVIINLKREGTSIHAGLATAVAGGLMISFLFFGSSLLHLFGVEVSSFALAGSLIIFFIGLEMTLGIRFFKEEQDGTSSGTVVPIAFPIVAGAGTLTTILSLRSQFDYGSIIMGILLNLTLVFIVLRSSGWLAKKLSPQVLQTMRKVFGILLIAIAFQMLRANL